VEEEVIETGGNSTVMKETEDENEKKTTENGNNNAPEQRDKMDSPSDINIHIKTEVVIESPPPDKKKGVESSTQF